MRQPVSAGTDSRNTPQCQRTSAIAPSGTDSARSWFNASAWRARSACGLEQPARARRACHRILRPLIAEFFLDERVPLTAVSEWKQRGGRDDSNAGDRPRRLERRVAVAREVGTGAAGFDPRHTIAFRVRVPAESRTRLIIQQSWPAYDQRLRDRHHARPPNSPIPVATRPIVAGSGTGDTANPAYAGTDANISNANARARCFIRRLLQKESTRGPLDLASPELGRMLRTPT